MRFTASEVADLVGGRLVGPDVEINGASIDSRTILGGELFVAVVAERDGHDFIADALQAGAAAYLTDRAPEGGTAIVVDDTLGAFTRLGAGARARIPDRVVGVTGSVGKTTVKDLCAAALSSTFVASASDKSHNNEIGVPLTLVNVHDDAEAVVIEMGARGLDHIAQLCDVARPTVGIVTTVGLAHTELFGHLDEIVRAKGELVEALPASGTAVLNADLAEVAGMASRTKARVLTFGFGDADVRASDVHLDAELRPRFHLDSPWGSVDVALEIRGEHQVTNALAASAAALAVGVGLPGLAEGLGSARLSPWRMELDVTPTGALVLNDAYNANPASMAAALRSLALLRAHRRVAVIGPMAELGDHAVEQHRAITALARELDVRVIAVGALDYGPGAEHVADLEGALELLGNPEGGDAVLLKGSRVAGLERLAELLLSGG
jgi:UDP-N-acetylmuramoyl-tripeptide--D-alanyl-D-alanine ligase